MLWRNLLPLLSFLVFSCDGSETPTQIFSHLMKNYSRNEPPGFPDKPTEVRLGIYVNNVQYLGDETSDFRISCYLRQAWKDPRLSFSTTDGKMKQIRLPEDSWKQIWVPDTFVRRARSVKVDDDMSSDRFLRVKPNGEVLYVMKVSIVVPSRFQLQRFPFDKQVLELHFESFGYTMDLLYFSTLTHPIDVERHLPISQFRTTGVSSEDCSANYTSGAYPCLSMIIALERISYRFLLQFYLPSILIVILSWLAFWIDIDTSSPSRLLTGILSFLALILLDAVVGPSPFTVDYKTAFDCWVIACYVFVFGTLVQFAVVNILSKKPSGARGLEQLKPTIAWAEKAIEGQNEKLVDGSGEDEKRKIRLVDWFSRIFFPIAFLLFNLIYWIMVSA